MDRTYFGKKNKERYESFGYSGPFERGRYFSSGVGVSTHPRKEALSQVKSKIRAGARSIEVNLSGKGKASAGRGKLPAGAYGMSRRREIKNLMDINKVKRSVHSPVNLSMVQLDRQGNFQKRQYEEVMDELKQSIDFAHDIGGENVVVHTSMANRPFERKWGKKFRKEESKRGRVYRYVDEETGQGFSISDDESVPVWKKGNEYIPVKGKKKPEGAELSRIKVQDAVERGLDPKKLVLSGQIARRQSLAEGEIQRFEDIKERSENAYEALKKLEKSGVGELSEEDREALREDVGGIPSPGRIESHKKRFKRRRDWARNSLIRYKSQAQEMEELKGRIEDANKFMKEKALKGTVELAKKSYKKYKDSGKKVTVAPENMFPEAYGGHPDELMELIKESRRKFIGELQDEEGVSKSKAKELARDFIGATFDLAHANLWRKYWDEDKTKKDFKGWLKGKADKLSEQELLQEIHVADNFGYEDHHLAVGEGNVPNKEIIERLEKKGIPIRVIAEPGAPGTEEYRGLTRAHKHLGTKLYPGGPTYKEAVGRTYGQAFYSTTAKRTQVGKSRETWSGVPI